jgi:uncharacterized repeat protein (TIGR01451 family)
MNPKSIIYRLAAVGCLAAAVLAGMLYLDRQAVSASAVDQIISFFDNFSGDLSQWEVSAGDWLIDQGELQGTGWGGMIDAWIYAGDTAWTDYILQAQVNFVSSNAILVVRSTGHWVNEYRIDLWMQGGENSNQYQLVRYKDGVETVLIPLAVAPVPITDPCIIRIEARGDTLVLYINGQFVVAYTDLEPLLSGRIGLGVIWNYTSRFDDVMVSPFFASKTVNKSLAHPGELLNYTVTASNQGSQTVQEVQVSDILSYGLTYQEGTLSASSGSADFLNGVITWTGPITASQTVTISFAARVDPSPEMIGDSIINTASISDGVSSITASATTDILPYLLYLPCLYRPCLPDVFTDNFSDPASGWEVEEDTIYKLAYVDGEYQILVKPEGYIVWSVQDFGVYDYQVEVDARPVKHLNGGVGIMFSISDWGFYYYEISDGWYGLWRVSWDPWEWTTLVDWTTSSAIKTGFNSNHLKVVRVQGLIELYVNGTLLASLNDYTYTGSWIGMASEGWADKYDTRYDNFTLTTGCLGVTGQQLSTDSGLWVEGAGGRSKR